MSPWVALKQLIFFTGLAVLVTAFPRSPETPHATSAWTDETIRTLIGRDRLNWRDWTPSLVGMLCLLSALTLEFADLRRPPTRLGDPIREAAAVTAPATPTVFQRWPVSPTPTLTPVLSATLVIITPTNMPRWTLPVAWWPPAPTLTPPRPTSVNQAFRFSLQPPIYLTNFGNGHGCHWSGLAGQVFDAAGDPVTGYIARLWAGTTAQDVIASERHSVGQRQANTAKHTRHSKRCVFDRFHQDAASLRPLFNCLRE